jgi:hypothetical protein
MRLRILLAAACIAVTACCQAPGASRTPASTTTRDPGEVECPVGKPARPGLQNFGAYIGTWETNRRHDTLVAADYVIGTIPGHVSVRCSSDGFVIVEQIHPLFHSPEGQALRVALTEVPEDSETVYDHLHAGCRTFQYRSQALARQLGPDDNDGRVNIVFRSDGDRYNPGSVTSIVLDLVERLGADTREC